MKFLILLLFITLNAFAVTTVNNNAVIGKTLKVAETYNNGSYIDGSFENDLSGWTGDGTFTATTSGSLNGTSALWALTGTGTRSTTLDTTKLSGTDLEASIFTSSPDTSLYFCVTVSSVDSCVQNVNNSGWHQLKVYFNASASTIIKLKYLGASLSGKFDEVKIAPMSLSVGQTVDEIVNGRYVGTSGQTVTSTPSAVVFNVKEFDTHNAFSSSSLTIPVAGKYHIDSELYVTSNTWGTASALWVSVYKNGVSIYQSNYIQAHATAYIGIVGRINETFSFNKNDIVQIYVSGNSSNAMSLNSVATLSWSRLVSTRDNVAIAGQAPDRIGETIYLPQNVAPAGFIPANGVTIGYTSGTYQGAAYLDLYRVLWSIATTTSTDPYYISSAKGSTADADWAANKTIKIDESGLFTRAYLSGTSEAVGAKQADAFQGHYHDMYTNGSAGGSPGTAIEGAPNTGTFILNNDSWSARGATTDATYGTARVASETRPMNVAKYVFIRYSVSSPTLLALPVSKENVFSANISSAGAISSQGASGIASVTKNSTGNYTATLTSGLFSVTPAAQVTTVGLNTYASIVSKSASSITYQTYKSLDTNWTAYTPSVGNLGTVTNIKAYYRRQGSTYQVYGSFNSGTPAAANPAYITLPNTAQFNTTVLPNSGQGTKQLVGQWSRPTNFPGSYQLYASSDYPYYVILGGMNAGITSMNAINADTLVAAGNYVTFSFEIPISGALDVQIADVDVTLSIQKQLSDYNPQGVFISNINPDGFNKTAGQTGLIDTFSVTYGTGDSNTPCSASPCSYIDKIGNYVTNVTRVSTGAYPISFSKTFTKLKCNFNGNNAAGGGVMSQLPLTCSNCSSIQLQTITTANAAIDSTGTLLCQGY